MSHDQAFAPVSVILTVAIAIVLVAVASSVLLVEGPEDEPVAAEFKMSEQDRLEALKIGGEALDAQTTEVRMESPDGSVAVPVEEIPRVGSEWTNGIRVCLAGDGPQCLDLVGTDEIHSVTIVYRDQVVYVWDGDVDLGDLGTGGGPTFTLGDTEQDPGHAYEDVNNDAYFSAGIDDQVPDTEIQDGEYHVDDDWSLVVPESTDPIDTNTVNLSAGDGGHLVLETDVESDDGGIRIEAGDHVDAEEANFTTDDEDLVIEADEGPLRLEGATFDVEENRIDLSSGGDIHASGANFVTQNEQVTFQASGAVDLEGATHNASETMPIAVTGDLDLRDTVLSTEDDITIDATEDATIDIDGATIDDSDGTAIVTPEGATIEGTPAEGEVTHG